MIKALPLTVIDGKTVSPCVNSGFCCKQSPCPFGESKPGETSCIYLEQLNNNGHPRFICGIADIIITKPGWEISPAFGAGCCSSIGNIDRSIIIGELRSQNND